MEYLTRIEQGRDRNPSVAVVNALADALSLDVAERNHLRYLSKISGGECVAGRALPAPPDRSVRPGVRQILDLLEPGVGLVTNRLGDVLAYTGSFALVMGESGLLDAEEPNLTRYVFTHPRAEATFPEWHQVADEQAFDMWLGPTTESFAWFTADFTPTAGAEFARRRHHHLPPPAVPLVLDHPRAGRLRWDRETLELPAADGQQVVVWLPADEATAGALAQMRPGPLLRAV